jgi:hypothetical protein
VGFAKASERNRHMEESTSGGASRGFPRSERTVYLFRHFVWAKLRVDYHSSLIPISPLWPEQFFPIPCPHQARRLARVAPPLPPATGPHPRRPRPTSSVPDPPADSRHGDPLVPPLFYCGLVPGTEIPPRPCSDPTPDRSAAVAEEINRARHEEQGVWLRDFFIWFRTWSLAVCNY